VRWRSCILAVLVYVALDLSLPAMPGAFVFEIDHTVESTQDSRARVTAQPDAAPRPQPLVALPRRTDPDAGWRRLAVSRPARATPARAAARAAVPDVPPLDEPH
jgi:hypothetical protein